jgi:hypothetical protein
MRGRSFSGIITGIGDHVEGGILEAAAADSCWFADFFSAFSVLLFLSWKRERPLGQLEGEMVRICVCVMAWVGSSSEFGHGI